MLVIKSQETEQKLNMKTKEDMNVKEKDKDE